MFAVLKLTLTLQRGVKDIAQSSVTWPMMLPLGLS